MSEEEEDEDEDEQVRFDREARSGYRHAKAAVMRSLLDGRFASADEFTERDVHMYRLSDANLQAEYGWYTAIYLAEDTPSAVRGMAEMTLIKLGKKAGQPQRQASPSPSPSPTPAPTPTPTPAPAPQQPSSP